MNWSGVLTKTKTSNDITCRRLPENIKLNDFSVLKVFYMSCFFL